MRHEQCWLGRREGHGKVLRAAVQSGDHPCSWGHRELQYILRRFLSRTEYTTAGGKGRPLGSLVRESPILILLIIDYAEARCTVDDADSNIEALAVCYVWKFETVESDVGRYSG